MFVQPAEFVADKPIVNSPGSGKFIFAGVSAFEVPYPSKSQAQPVTGKVPGLVVFSKVALSGLHPENGVIVKSGFGISFTAIKRSALEIQP